MKEHANSSAWLAIRARNRKQIEAWQEELERLNVAPDRAQQLRGMIFALRELAEEVQPTTTPIPKIEAPNYEQ